MKRMRLLSLLLALVLVCTAMPVTAAAADGLANATVCTTHTVHTEGQSAEDCTGLAPYLAPDGTAWAAVGDDTTKVKTWHCFQQNIDAALTDALHRMLRRETAFTLYIVVKKSDYDPTTDKLQKALYERLRSNALAEKAGTIEGGDFLDAQIQDFRQDDLKISWLNVEGYDDWNGQVAFYEVHCTFKYCDTVQQMEILRQAAKKWNQLFVTDNPTIAAEKDTNRRQYLIVKTIYDFLAENTVYNTAAYENFMNHQVTDWYAHTAYAAFFGLTGQGAADLDSTGYDWSVRQKNSLTVIGTTGQGKALRQNKDYTVSIATRGTTRTVTVQGKGNFNSRRQFKIHVHAYKCTAKKAATYFATGYKKYKCTACGAKKTEKLAQLKPAVASLKSSKKGRLTVKWKKGSGISGYQISYSTSSKFTKSTTKSVTITKAGSTAKTLTKLKSKKKYYVRIRVYKKQKGGKLYGAWSPVKSTKVR